MELIYSDGHREIVDSKPVEITPITMPYEEQVIRLIRQRYSISDELAIQRQRNEKPDEFKAYYDYCEKCKLTAKGGSNG